MHTGMVRPSVQLCLDPQLSPSQAGISTHIVTTCSASSACSKSNGIHSDLVGGTYILHSQCFTMQQQADTLQIQFIARISVIKTSPETPHVIHTANTVQDSALIQHAATNKFRSVANKT